MLRQGRLHTLPQGTQLYEEMDDPRALALLESARELAEASVRDDPANLQAQQNLAKTHLLLGTITLRLQQPGRAVSHLERGAETLRDLERTEHNARPYQVDLGRAAVMLGQAQAQQNRLPEAVASYAEAILRFEAVRRADPANAMPLRKLATAHTYMGDARRQLASNRPSAEATQAADLRESARESYRKAVAHLCQLEARQPLLPYDHAQLQALQRVLGELGGE